MKLMRVEEIEDDHDHDVADAADDDKEWKQKYLPYFASFLVKSDKAFSKVLLSKEHHANPSSRRWYFGKMHMYRVILKKV